MSQALRDRRVEWGPVFLLGWMGAVVGSAILLLVYGLVPSDPKGAALLLLVVGPIASVVYVACGLALAAAVRWLRTTAVGRRLHGDTRSVSPLRILAGVAVVCLFVVLVTAGATSFLDSAVGAKVLAWLEPHFH